MAVTYPAAFDFPDEGVTITLHTPTGGGDYEVIQEDLPSTPISEVVRQVIKLLILKDGKKISGTYPGVVILQVWYLTGENNFTVYLYDDTPSKLREDQVQGVTASHPTNPDFIGHFTVNYDEDQFPDPNVGVGP